MKFMQVIVNNLLTNYERAGSGKTVVILHGWADSLSNWRTFQNKLATDYQVIIVALPGFGGSKPPLDAWGLDEYAQFVADFLAKIDAPHVFAILGHSNGGAIAIRGLSQGVLQAERLVLLASAGIRGTQATRNKLVQAATKLGKVLASPLPPSLQKQLRRRLYQTVGSDMLVVEQLQETFKRIVSQDVRADAARIIQPTLLVYGENDKQTPVSYGQLYHQLIKHSRLHTLPGAGHFLQLDAPDVVAKIVTEFLQ